MNETREKLPLHAELRIEDTYHYRLIDGVDKQLQPMSHAETLMSFPEIVGWVDWNKELLNQNDAEPSKELQECFVAAKRFVEQLTGYDLSKVDLFGAIAPDGDDVAMYHMAVDGNIRSNIDITSPDY